MWTLLKYIFSPIFFMLRMADLDVGQITIASSTLGPYTIITKNNPANAPGNLDHIEISIETASTTNVKVASFTQISEYNFSTNGYDTCNALVDGINVLDAPGDFTAFSIDTGEFIGCYVSNVNQRIRNASSGYDGMWYVGSADKIPCVNYFFSSIGDYGIYLYGEGTAIGGTDHTKAFSESVTVTDTPIITFIRGYAFIAQRYITARKNMTPDDIRRMKNDFPNIPKGDLDQMVKDLREIMKDFE